MRTQITACFSSALVLAVALPTVALAERPACAKAFDKVLTQRLDRITAIVEGDKPSRSMEFAREVRALWKLTKAHKATGCDTTTASAPDQLRLTVDDGWRVYQAICTNTLDRRLKKRLRQLRTDLRARRHEAVRQGVMALAADLGRDPQYAECKGLTARLDRLMTDELPTILKHNLRDEAQIRSTITAKAE